MAYSGDRVRASLATLTRLSHQGLAIVTYAAEGGWVAGMWSAQVTAAGRAHIAAIDGHPDTHPGCGGQWVVDGTCTRCSQLRALTDDAEGARLGALSDSDRRAQLRAPALSCPVHGWVRPWQVTTTKVCPQCRQPTARRMARPAPVPFTTSREEH